MAEFIGIVNENDPNIYDEDGNAIGEYLHTLFYSIILYPNLTI